ncbi:gentisate 1,2-dioxygenase [Colletotrichum tofieldiae]|nr:gentisate 1,2-dioxygenase [Colletotrichum tofieldiae]
MPNETAKAHRHTAFAMRFIIEGNGGFTAVHGKRIQMNRGDVILTPTWNWHDHGKDGSGPMIWLDGLDLPNFTHFPVHFVEHFSSPRYPAENVDTSQSPIVFPWDRMKAVLDSEKGHYATRRYLRADGSEASSVYHVIEGSGQTQIGDKIFVWKKGDTFCIPTWYPYQHSVDKGLKTAAYLYRFDDIPMLKSLGFYRSADMDVESIVSV